MFSCYSQPGPIGTFFCLLHLLLLAHSAFSCLYLLTSIDFFSSPNYEQMFSCYSQPGSIGTFFCLLHLLLLAHSAFSCLYLLTSRDWVFFLQIMKLFSCYSQPGPVSTSFCLLHFLLLAHSAFSCLLASRDLCGFFSPNYENFLLLFSAWSCCRVLLSSPFADFGPFSILLPTFFQIFFLLLQIMKKLMFSCYSQPGPVAAFFCLLHFLILDLLPTLTSRDFFFF